MIGKIIMLDNLFFYGHLLGDLVLFKLSESISTQYLLLSSLAPDFC